jgi:hypothetical protein
MDITSTLLDDYVVINNLEEFKIQLRVQQSYCNEVQIEMKRLQDKLIKREKKYQRLKTENEQLNKRIIELERDLINTKDFFQRYMMLSTGPANPIQSHNCIQMISMSAPTPITEQSNRVLPANLVVSNSTLTTTNPISKSRPTQTHIGGMNSVINELKNKFNNVL